MKELLQGFYSTSSLWKNQQFGLQQFKFPWLNVAELNSIDLPNNLRLGHQMEYVFKHLISKSEEYEVILNNILIEEEKNGLVNLILS